MKENKTFFRHISKINDKLLFRYTSKCPNLAQNLQHTNPKTIFREEQLDLRNKFIDK